MDTTTRKRRHVLPQETVDLINQITNTEERNNYFAALREGAWTLQSIADATGLSREGVRQAVSKATGDSTHPVPTPPSKPTKEPRQYNEPDPGVLARLQALQPAAELARGEGSKYYEQGLEYTELLWQQHNEKGVPIYRLAKNLNVSHGAIRFRLARYGYKEPTGGAKSAVFKPLKHLQSKDEN